MAYLIYNDYKKQIQSENLQQIISQDITILSAAERAAQAEAISYLRQKYYTDREFLDTRVWNTASTYYAGDRVYLDAAAYNTAASYAINALTLYNGSVYICTTATTGTFNPAHWTVIGAQYDIFSAKYPCPEFDYNGVYKVGDYVYWKGGVYTCKVQTPLLSHDVGIQYYRIENLPQRNVAPDDPTEGAAYWGGAVVAQNTSGFVNSFPKTTLYEYDVTADTNSVTITTLIGKSILMVERNIQPDINFTFNIATGTITFANRLMAGEKLYIMYVEIISAPLTQNYVSGTPAYIAPGTLPTNDLLWAKTDNRDQQMVTYFVDITLYHIHSRIAPRNIPELRVKRYDDAIAWLKMCAKGDITPNLPLLKPTQGTRIRFGGQIRNINSY